MVHSAAVGHPESDDHCIGLSPDSGQEHCLRQILLDLYPGDLKKLANGLQEETNKFKSKGMGGWPPVKVVTRRSIAFQGSFV